MGNPQTDRLLQKLVLTHVAIVSYYQAQVVMGESEIDLECVEEEDSPDFGNNDVTPTSQ